MYLISIARPSHVFQQKRVFKKNAQKKEVFLFDSLCQKLRIKPLDNLFELKPMKKFNILKGN